MLNPFCVSAMLVMSLCFLVGCAPEGDSLRTEYGRIQGVDSGKSVNGTGAFADMFAEQGFKVKRRSKISPRIEKFQTIVWMPDDIDRPSPKAVDALNEWLEMGWGRTLIYVGRGYDCQLDYVRLVAAKAPVEEKEEWLRQLTEARLASSEPSSYDQLLPTNATPCEWFEIKSNERRKAKRLTGDLAAGVEAENASVEISNLLSPVPPASAAGLWDSKTLLSTDRMIFAFELTNESTEYNEGKIVIVSNGSFLLNFSLVNNAENQKLAGNLIDYVDGYGDVLFLESDYRGIKVSSSDTTNHNQWSWISEGPLRYIVPHLLAWGILFCFVFFPIFGRPKNTKKRSISTFRNHINAIGKLLSQSKLPNRAKDTIEKYQDMVSGESKRKQPRQK